MQGLFVARPGKPTVYPSLLEKIMETVHRETIAVLDQLQPDKARRDKALSSTQTHGLEPWRDNRCARPAPVRQS